MDMDRVEVIDGQYILNGVVVTKEELWQYVLSKARKYDDNNDDDDDE